MSEKPPVVRRGKPLFLTIDYDAVALLEAMVPSSKKRGSFCSDLIRREAERRAERPTLVQALREASSAQP